MKRIYIIHGYTGHPEKNWFPWLKTEIEKLGHQVEVPAMPNPNSPKLDQWLEQLNNVITSPNEEVFLIGHSLGCPTILRYLESLEKNQVIGGAILVAGFAEPLPNLPELDSFTEGPWDDEKIKSHIKNITIINSDNDQAVPISNGEHIRDRFNAELITVHNLGHINEKAGIKEVPFVLNKLKEKLNS